MKNDIQNLFLKLVEEDTDNSLVPSRLLKQIIGPEFKVDGIGLKYMGACAAYDTSTDEKLRTKDVPLVRNAIDQLGVFTLGEAFKIRVNEDTFYSPSRQVNTRQLDLSVTMLGTGQELPKDSFLAFDIGEQTFYGLALDGKFSFFNFKF